MTGRLAAAAPLRLACLCILAAAAAARAGAGAGADSSGTRLQLDEDADDWLRPGYHFTRQRYHMNDPNGLMWRRDASGQLQYHMFFQSADPHQVHPSQWGHTVSPDLVRFKRVPRTLIRGSSGGGVTLPPGFVPPPELANAKAVAINSGLDSPSLTPPTGLHLWSLLRGRRLHITPVYICQSGLRAAGQLPCIYRIARLNICIGPVLKSRHFHQHLISS